MWALNAVVHQRRPDCRRQRRQTEVCLLPWALLDETFSSGILKSRLPHGTESAALLSGYESDAVVYCGPHGSLRLFEVYYSLQGTQKKQCNFQQRSVGRLQIPRHSPPSPSRSDHYAQHRRQRLTAYRPTPPPNGYSTDTEDAHAAHLQHVAALCTPKQLRRRLFPVRQFLCCINDAKNR